MSILTRNSIHTAYATMDAVKGQRGNGGESPGGKSLSQMDLFFPASAVLFAVLIAIRDNR